MLTENRQADHRQAVPLRGGKAGDRPLADQRRLHERLTNDRRMVITTEARATAALGTGHLVGPGLRHELREWLEEVVIWLNHDYTRDASGIPRCWPLHTCLIHEIAVLPDQR